MSLYPSFDQTGMMPEVTAIQRRIEDDAKIKNKPDCASYNTESSVVPHNSSNFQSLYPALSEYMGLDLTEQSRKHNIVAKSNTSGNVITIPAVPGQVTHGLRRLTLCKDVKGRVGLLVSAINNGIFVCFVLKDSPAALGGLRFGDQILQINETLLAGYSADKVHSLIKKMPVNNINFIIRDRPFERTITMQKDSMGHFGFQFHKGKIETLVKDSSAARNGLVTEHHLLEVQGQNVVNMDDKEIKKILESSGGVATVTIIPSFLYEQIMKKMRKDFVKAKMDHSTHV